MGNKQKKQEQERAAAMNALHDGAAFLNDMQRDLAQQEENARHRAPAPPAQNSASKVPGVRVIADIYGKVKEKVQKRKKKRRRKGSKSDDSNSSGQSGNEENDNEEEDFKPSLLPSVKENNKDTSPNRLFKMPTTKVKGKATSAFDFQRENAKYHAADTLLDSLMFLLLKMEKVRITMEDQEVADLVQNNPKSESFSNLLKLAKAAYSEKSPSLSPMLAKLKSMDPLEKLIEGISSLDAAIRHPLLEASGAIADDGKEVTIAQLFVKILDKYNEEGLDATQYNFSALLLQLARIDLASIQKKKPVKEQETLKALTENKELLVNHYNTHKIHTVFAQELFRLSFNSSFESLSTDEVTEDVISAFKNYILHEMANHTGFEFIKTTGTQVLFSNLNSKYTHFDFTNQLSIGLYNLDLSFETSLNRRTLFYILPDGRKIDIENLGILSKVNFKNVAPDAPSMKKLKFSTVLEGVTKLQCKEAFAVSDYDWIMIVYSPWNTKFHWAFGGEDISEASSIQTNFVYFVSFHERISDVNNCLKVPIGKALTFGNNLVQTRSHSKFDLYLSQKLNATANELVQFVNDRLHAYGIVAVIKLKDLCLQNLVTRKVYRFKSKDETILSALEKIDCKFENLPKRELPYICYYDNKEVRREVVSSTQSTTVNETKEESIRLSKTNNNFMLKSNLQSLMDFFLTEGLKKGTCEALGHVYYKGHPANFYLPAYLIIDVSKVSSNLIDPKGSIDLAQIFEDSIKEDALLISPRYVPRGMVCKAIYDTSEYYPVEVNWEKKRCTAYLGKRHEFKLSDIDDRYVAFLLLERIESSDF